MSRRANGEGTIYKRKDGRWTARISLPGGKRKDFFGKTRAEVAAKLATAMKANQDGAVIVSERQTVGQFLRSWLEGIKPSVRPTTFATYETISRLHVVPYIGHHRLSHLRPQHLQRLYSERLDAGLSPQSVRKLHAVVHRALEQATRWDLVTRNVAHYASPPRDRHRDVTTLTREEAKTLLAESRSDRLHALYVLALTTGMRQGELLALHWRDVDLGRGSLQVRGTVTRAQGRLVIAEPKTPGSRRSILLGKTAVAALRGHRSNQAAERLRAGSGWEELDLVFANETGRPIEASNLRRRSFEPLLKKAELPRIRFHDLRHTAATLLLEQGIHPKIVSERLGHSRVAITLDLYSHVTPTMQNQAAEAMEVLLGA